MGSVSMVNVRPARFPDDTSRLTTDTFGPSARTGTRIGHPPSNETGELELKTNLKPGPAASVSSAAAAAALLPVDGGAEVAFVSKEEHALSTPTPDSSDTRLVTK